MIRRKHSKIHNPDHQMMDFFKDDSMKRIIPNNPYNILWVIEKYFPNDNEYKFLKQHANECIKQSYLCEAPNAIAQKLINDYVVMERVKELKKEFDVNLDLLSCKAIRMRSEYLVKSLLDMGMNPNAQFQEKYPLLVAIGRRNQPIIAAYWNDPRTNRTVTDIIGENAAFVAIRNKNWKLLKIIFQDAPELILSINNNSETIFDILSKTNDGKGLFMNHVNIDRFKKLPDKLQPLLLDMMHYFHINNKSLSINHMDIDLTNIFKEFNYNKLRNELEQENKITVKKNKI